LDPAEEAGEPAKAREIPGPEAVATGQEQDRGENVFVLHAVQRLHISPEFPARRFIVRIADSR